MKRRNRIQRLSRHLRSGGDRQWNNCALVNLSVYLIDASSNKPLQEGILRYGSHIGFIVEKDNRRYKVDLNGIRRVSPNERIIYCNGGHYLR